MKAILSGYVNLLKTSVGSGILSFPYLFKIYGIGPAIILTFFFGALTLVGLNIFTNCSIKIVNPNLSTLTHQAFPEISNVVTIAIFIKCLGVATSYLIVIRQLLPKILSYIFLTEFGETTVLTICLLIFAPICYFKKIDKLKITSTFGLMAIFFIVVASIYRYKTSDSQIYLEKSYNDVSFLWIDNFSKFIFAFTCHMNFFSVLHEFQHENKKIMKNISLFVVLSALLFYLAFGYSNYKLYNQGVKDNVLENYPDDSLASLIRLFYVIVMIFSYPLQVNPCRTCFLAMFNIKSKKTENIMSVIITTVIIIITYSIAISGIELGVVYKIIGATSSTLMCLILPALYYLKLESDKKRFLIIFSYFTLSLGIFVFISTISRILFKYFVQDI